MKCECCQRPKTRNEFPCRCGINTFCRPCNHCSEHCLCEEPEIVAPLAVQLQIAKIELAAMGVYL